MSNENNTIDFESRLKICALSDRLRGQLAIMQVLFENSEAMTSTTISELFSELDFAVTEIKDIAFGEYDSSTLFAAPKEAFKLFRAISDKQMQMCRDDMVRSPVSGDE